MTEIKIPFNEWSKKKLTEWKRATSRTKKYGDVDDIFFVDLSNGKRQKYKIDFIAKFPLEFITYELYDSEGCCEPGEFVIAWEKIHPKKGYIPKQEVWYHHFEEIRG